MLDRVSNHEFNLFLVLVFRLGLFGVGINTSLQHRISDGIMESNLEQLFFFECHFFDKLTMSIDKVPGDSLLTKK